MKNDNQIISWTVDSSGSNTIIKINIDFDELFGVSSKRKKRRSFRKIPKTIKRIE